MKFSTTKKIILIIAITIIAATLTIAALLNFTKDKETIPTLVGTNPTIITEQETLIGLPIQITIPSIGVDAAIYYVRLADDGTMDILQDTKKVGWYSLGTIPGDIGSAVIAGHYGWDNNGASVFNEIHTLKSGDEILITDENKSVSTFVVTGIVSYSPDADASDIFKSNDNKSHLNLITCSGTWENSKNSYSDRTVVFADKKI